MAWLWPVQYRTTASCRDDRALVHAAAHNTSRLATKTGAECITIAYAIHINAPIICIRRSAGALVQKYDDTKTAVAAHPR
jgi:hypothetical protein